LRPEDHHQSEEEDLMPYSLLGQLEELAIAKGKSPTQVYDELKEAYLGNEAVLIQNITKFYSLWAKNQWKRERSAPSFNLDIFNINPRSWYRFPILSSGFKEELKNLNRLI